MKYVGIHDSLLPRYITTGRKYVTGLISCPCKKLNSLVPPDWTRSTGQDIRLKKLFLVLSKKAT